LAPELVFGESDNKPVSQNVEHRLFPGFEFDETPFDLSPVMRVAIFLPTTTFEHV
jgi:hypothetical protein